MNQIEEDRTPSTYPWLLTEPKWRVGLGDGWAGRLILGIYSLEGITGLWQLSNPASSKHLSSVVVKQVLEKGIEPPMSCVESPGSKREVDAYEVLNKAGSKFIIRTLRDVQKDITQNTPIPADEGGMFVERLVLEYAPGGDMGKFLKGLSAENGGTALEGEDAWWIFRCLAMACSVCERGTEDLKKPAWEHEIAHLDLKPANVFVGSFDNEKDRLPIFKFGDFGTAEDISKYPEDYQQLGNPRYNAIRSEFSRGKDLQPPEMYNQLMRTSYPVKNTRIGSSANIWQVGVLMYLLLRRLTDWKIYDVHPRPLHLGPRPIKNKRFDGVEVFHGHELFDENHEVTRLYSEELRVLILECLLRKPDQRSSAAELQKRVEEGWNKWRGTAKKPIQHPQIIKMDHKPRGKTPPAHWALEDQDTINILAFIRSHADMPATYTILQNFHRNATVAAMIEEIELRIFFTLPIRKTNTGRAKKSVWYKRRFLDEHLTLREIDVKNYDSVQFFWE